MIEFVSGTFVGFGALLMIAALVIIAGFILSVPIGLGYAIKDHHEHREPHVAWRDRPHRRVHVHLPHVHGPASWHLPASWHMPDARSLFRRK